MAHARAAMAWVLVLSVVLAAQPARAQPCECEGANALVPLPFDPSEAKADLETLLASGAIAATTSYVLGFFLARDTPHTPAPVYGLPVLGPIWAASQSPLDGNRASALTLLAGTTAMGVLVVVGAADELAALRRLDLAINAGPGGCGATFTLRLP